MLRVTSLLLISLSCVLLSAALLAQEQTPLSPSRVPPGAPPGTLVRVMVAAPIFVIPDATRDPLRVAREGSMLRLIDENNGWTYVEFADPQYQRRFGYIQSRFVRAVVAAPPQEPIDLSVPEARQQQPPTPQPPVQTERPAVQPPPARRDEAPDHVRTKTAPRHVLIAIDAAQIQTVDRSLQTFTFSTQVAQETARAQSLYPDLSGVNATDFDFAVLVGIHEGLGIGVHVDGVNYKNTVGLAVSVPSPYFFNTVGTDAGITNTMLEREERAVDINASYTFRTPEWLVVRAFGGPTYFHVTNAMVGKIIYNQVASSIVRINVVSITSFTQQEVTGWGIGFNLGADASFFFSRHVGLGGGARFNRGTASIADPLSGTKDELRLGHLVFNGGLRLRF